MFDTWSELLVLAVILTIVSLRWHNLLFSFGATIGWLVLWIFNLNTPPTGITQGSVAHEFLTYIFIIMAIAVMLIYFINGKRGYTGYPKTAREQAQYNSELKSIREQPNGGMMEESTEEYRQRVRRALRTNRNRR